MMIIWCVFVVPLVSILDGAVMGLALSLGRPEGAIAGILITAALLYSQAAYIFLAR